MMTRLLIHFIVTVMIKLMIYDDNNDNKYENYNKILLSVSVSASRDKLPPRYIHNHIQTVLFPQGLALLPCLTTGGRMDIYPTETLS